MGKSIEKDFRIYLEGYGFITVRVVIKGTDVFMLPLVVGVKIYDMATEKITDLETLRIMRRKEF